jgi:hypothetical protein
MSPDTVTGASGKENVRRKCLDFISKGSFAAEAVTQLQHL